MDPEKKPETVPQPEADKPEEDAAASTDPAADDEEEYVRGSGGQGSHIVRAELGEMNEIESLCPKCEENGITRFMFTNIPHFKEVIVSSFECPHCGESNNSVSFGGIFGAKKVRYELDVKAPADMGRQVVKSEYATITIPELQLEIPPESQKGSLSTVEGILDQTKAALDSQQPLRKIEHPKLHDQIAAFCDKLEEYRSGNVPFTLVLDDPAGNSYIEGRYEYYHPTIDAQLTKYEKERTDIDRQLLGVSIEYNTARTDEQERQIDDGLWEGVTQIPCHCPACKMPGDMNMKETAIPYFKDTIIMAFKCDHCGYKSNEIKTGGAVSEKGLKITLHVESEDDLKRDVLKSDSASLSIPELHLELAPGTLGGFFSSVEGTVMQIRDQLRDLPQAAFNTGDSADDSTKTMVEFVAELTELLEMKKKFTFILDDPLANIYIQNPRAHMPPPDNEDPRLEREEYIRSFDQDEELGLHDIEVDNNPATDDDEEAPKVDAAKAE